MSDLIYFAVQSAVIIYLVRYLDRIRNLEKAVNRIDPNALKDVKAEEASRNYW